MSSSQCMDTATKICKLEEKLRNKKLEIEKRREIVLTMSNTPTAKKKDEIKLDTINNKISSKIASIEKTIFYYQSEIEKAETKCEELKRIAEAKYEEAKRKAENSFDTYRQYCLAAIKAETEKREVITAPLEKKKELIETKLEEAEEDDKILVKLKVEKDQLEQEIKTAEKLFEEQSESERKLRQRQQQEAIRENMEKMRQLEIEEKYLAQQEIEARRFKEQQEESLRKERRLQEEEKENREQQDRKTKIETTKQQKNNFTKTIYPHLSTEASNVYKFFKNSVPALQEDVHSRETIEEAEEFLLSYLDRVTLLKDFEEGQYKNMTIPERDEYDELESSIEITAFFDRLKIAKSKGKKKNTSVTPLKNLSFIK